MVSRNTIFIYFVTICQYIRYNKFPLHKPHVLIKHVSFQWNEKLLWYCFPSPVLFNSSSRLLVNGVLPKICMHWLIWLITLQLKIKNSIYLTMRQCRRTASALTYYYPSLMLTISSYERSIKWVNWTLHTWTSCKLGISILIHELVDILVKCYAQRGGEF